MQDNCNKKTAVNLQYLGKTILEESNHSRFLSVKSGMGTGKTSAMKAIIANLPLNAPILFISPRKKLNFAMAHELSVNYYEDVKNEPNKDARAEQARRMVVTPQSLGAILEEFPDITFEYVVMDESQTIAGMMVSEATSDKIKTLEALKHAAKLAHHVIAMDAHLGVQTTTLMNILSGAEVVRTLHNRFASWANISADVLTGGDYTARRNANDAQQIKALQSGRRIAVCSSSATYCESRKQVLSTLFPHLKLLLITGKTTQEAQLILSKPETIKQWDAVIFSPAVSVGVSFDVENHVDLVFGVFPNAIRTGGSDDAIQALARIRKPTLKRWIITLDNDKAVFSDVPNAPNDIQEAVINRWYRENFKTGKSSTVSDSEQDVVNLYAVCEQARHTNKNNFNQDFLSRLSEMGVALNLVNVKQAPSNEVSKALAKQAKESAKTLSDTLKTTSPRLNEVEISHIRVKKKYRPDEVTEAENNAFGRYLFESKFNINCDNLQPDDIKKYLSLDDAGAIKKCINREIALAPAAFDKRYIKARISGVGSEDAFKVDILSDKLNYSILKKLLSYAVKYFDGLEYSHSDLNRGSLVQFVSRNYKEITALRIIALPSEWKKKPALLLSHLLELCGYKHKSRRIRVDGKRVYIFKAVKQEAIEQFYNDRLEDGRNWVESTNKLLDIYSGSTGEPLSANEIERLRMPFVDIRFVDLQLKRTPKYFHADLMKKYTHQYDVMNSDNTQGIDAPQYANQWLKRQVNIIVENTQKTTPLIA